LRKIYITFSGAQYEQTTNLIVDAAPKFGADEVWVYDDHWLKQTEFYRHNHWLWEHHGDQHNNKRGFGWFAWKPFIILDALDRLSDGDVVLFTDADTYPIAGLSPLYQECSDIGGAMLFSAIGWERCHQMWCKRDCFIVMGQDEERYWNADHGVARFMFFQKGPWKPRQFLYEWMTYCVNPLATTFDDNVIGHPNVGGPDGQTFKEHRTEQAIMTNLAHKYGFKLYREACQFGEGSNADRDLYPQLFVQDGGKSYNDGNGSRYRNVPPRNQ
jgi:hypothetical protein